MTRFNRHFAGALLAAALVAGGSAFAAPLKLDWADLIPSGKAASRSPTVALRGVVQHEQIPQLTVRSNPFLKSGAPPAEPPSAAAAPLRDDLHGAEVTMAGYVVPLKLDGTEVREFLLVPYVGACIHVPPPPANQIVFVSTDKGFEVSGLFQAVTVTGTMAVTPASTELAEAGYQLRASAVNLAE